MTNAKRALNFISDGMVVGLGSGAAAERFIHELALSQKDVRCVATSKASSGLAVQLGLKVFDLDTVNEIDVTVDGADEVDPNLNLIKGFGHAHVREKIVAAASKKLIILIGPKSVDEKLVTRLGQRGKIPVEVLEFGLEHTRAKLLKMGLIADRVEVAGAPIVSDNGNPLLECRTGPIADPAQLDAQLRAIPGVVGTGLFVGMAELVLIERNSAVEVRERK